MKIYKNNNTNKIYIYGLAITIKIGKGLFSGIPTEELLLRWGFEEYNLPSQEPTEEEIAERERQQRMNAILQELQNMDYLTSKYIDGEDMSQYGDWQKKRRLLREEYRELEYGEEI